MKLLILLIIFIPTIVFADHEGSGLHRIVNGVEVALTVQEEGAIRAAWAQARSNQPSQAQRLNTAKEFELNRPVMDALIDAMANRLGIAKPALRAQIKNIMVIP